MMVAIRTDSSIDIGTGHVTRCLTLATELTLQGCDVIFICRDFDGSLHHYIKNSGFDVKILPPPVKNDCLASVEPKLSHSSWLGASQETDAYESQKSLDGEDSVAWLVVDHYGIDKTWHRAMRTSGMKICVIDDLADREHDCDFLLDQSYFGEHRAERYRGLVPNDCCVRIGSEYSLLRPEFTEKLQKISDHPVFVETLFINFGGIDQPGMTCRVLKELLPILPLSVNVEIVTSSINPRLSEIEQLCSGKNFKLHVDTNRMAELMSKSDLAIGCGGVVALERAFIGLPSIVIPNAFNQQKALLDMANKGLISLLNNVDEIPKTIQTLFLSGVLPIRSPVKNGTKRIVEDLLAYRPTRKR